MPWPAAANALGDQPAAAPRAVPRDRLLGVLRTSRIKPAARRQHGAYEIPVPAHAAAQRAGDQDVKRQSNPRIRPTVPAEVRPPYGGRTSKSIEPSFSCSSRKASRMHLLMRLRSTAAAACRRVTRSPSRDTPVSRRRKKKVYPSMLRRSPSRKSRSNCALRRRRRAPSRPKRFFAAGTGTTAPAVDDRVLADCATPRVRPVCDCAREIRGGVRAASWTAGRCAS